MREDEVDGGFVATALGHSTAPQGDTVEELREMVRDAVRCHFGDGVPGQMPKIIRLHFVRALTPRDVSKENPETVFRDFVCDPMPPSVSDVKAGGGIAFAGGNVVVEFTIEDRDRETLLRQGKFSMPDKHDTEWITPNDPFGDEGGSTAYVRRVKGMSQIALYLAKNSNRARLQYISY